MAVSSQRQRLIIVEVKQKKGEGYFRLTLPEPVARKVLCWHIKLEIALEDANPDERLVIQDHTRRNEEVLLRVVEFLLDGHLPQLHYAEPDTYLLTLKKLVRMHDLAEKIELYALQRAICQKIEREPLMSLGLLLDYAAYVYRTVKGEPKHSPSSKLGQSIKRQLASFLPELKQSGLDLVNREAGEIVKDQLLEVMLESLGVKGVDGSSSDMPLKIEVE